MDKIEKKVADNYNNKHDGGQPAQQQPQQPPPQPQQQEHHHGKDVAKKFGNAVTFGAGATAGADAVNSLIH